MDGKLDPYITHHAYSMRDNKDMRRTRRVFTDANELTVGANCDLDLCPSGMVLAHGTLSCRDENLCHIIFKTHHT